MKEEFGESLQNYTKTEILEAKLDNKVSLNQMEAQFDKANKFTLGQINDMNEKIEKLRNEFYQGYILVILLK